MASVTETARNAVREFTEPLTAAVEENMRNVKRAVVTGRHAVEDRADDVRIQVRRHPFAALGVAAGVGMLIGWVVGITAGRRRRGTSA